MAIPVRRIGRAAGLGALLGALWVGVIGRVVMAIIANANPQASGMTSDDGFTIDQFTVNGSLNFLVFGTSIGAFGGVVYLALRGLRIGPGWFRLLSITLAPTVVTLSILVHPTGADFTLLEPLSLSIGLFLVVIWGYTLSLVLLGDRLVPAKTGSAPAPALAWVARAGLFGVFALAVANLSSDLSALA